MSGAELGIVLKGLGLVKNVFFDAVKDYVDYIGKCNTHVDELQTSLKDVCNMKDDIDRKVKEGEDRLEEISSVAGSWLKDVRLLTEEEELKGLMYMDMETAKYVVKMMGERDLRTRLSKESEMQELVIKVMKKLKEEMENPEEDEHTRKKIEVVYKKVAEVMVEVMKETIDGFKNLMKEDEKMAIIASRMLKDTDLDKLTRGDQEMEDVFRVAAAHDSDDEDLSPNHDDEESNAPLLTKPVVVVRQNKVKEAANKLLKPVDFLIGPVKKLLADDKIKKVVPEADSMILLLDVVDGVFIKGQESKSEIGDGTKQHRGCCCSTFSICIYYHGRYLLSKAAQSMAQRIQANILADGKRPQDPVTLRRRTQDLLSIPTQFLKGSRTKLLRRILDNLNDDRIHAVGLFGMGGTGKTILAREVNKRVKDMFDIKVMVEVSDAADIVRIQAEIAESIGLPLDDLDSISQRAIRLYNRLVLKKEKKNLIILDNVWTKLNLDDVGIPRTCKILLTTREREVCRAMDVKNDNIIEVVLMNTIEAKELFKSQAGNQANLREYKKVMDRLLIKCGGLPLTIVATANTLKDKDLRSWVKFADDLDKPMSSQVISDYRQTYSILDTSYKFIGVDEKRIFLLLACLIPLGSSASIESLMRYGIGLNLFQHVNKLCEAMEQANTWANELVLSSMLLESGVKGNVKIHDIVRGFIISFAAKEEGHKFMVEGIPRWLEDETFNKYTAMSLISRDDYSRLSGVEACKLQILILKGDLSENMSEFYFGGMVNLEVLDMSNMNFESSLPESMRELKKLRTLCMDCCKLGDIREICKLVNLIVLSLRESFLEELPVEIGELFKLRLLDLTGCISRTLPLIPAGVLDNLTRLEGLYMSNTTQFVFETEFDDEEITAAENTSVPYLNALEITVAERERLPIDCLSIQNVDTFRVFVGNHELTDKPLLFRRDLYFNVVNDLSDFLEKSCLGLLLKKAEFLKFLKCSNFDHLLPWLDQEGFGGLRSLHLETCYDMKCVVDGRAMNDVIAFPSLLSLQLSNLEDLEMVYRGEASPGSFSNLQTITVFNLEKVPYLLPLVPKNLSDVSVYCCELLKFLFVDEGETQATKLSSLKRLQLIDVPSLVSLVGPKHFFDNDDPLQGGQFFFDRKIELPSLENLEIESCHNVVKLWSNDTFKSGFQNLNEIAIENCKKLSSLGSLSIFSTLVQLETLIIARCDEIREIITLEETEKPETIIRFPLLKYLELKHSSNFESFYGGGSTLEFPKLKKMEMQYLGRMNRFAKLENSTALFHKRIHFPCLDELKVTNVNVGVEGLWDVQASEDKLNPAPLLRQLTLGSTEGLRQIPSVVLKNLTSLRLEDFESDEVVFASSDLEEKEGFVWVYTQLPSLVELEIKSSKSVVELFKIEDCSDDSSNALELFCNQVKTLGLVSLPSLNFIPLHLFKALTSLTLNDLKWEYFVSVDALGDSLRQLQILNIEKCTNMEALIINVGSLIKFPQLRRLRLWDLWSLVSLSSTSVGEVTLHLPLLESLEIGCCHKLEHFWSASIKAPSLQDVTLSGCGKMLEFLIVNPEDFIQLPSLQTVIIQGCTIMKAFISGSISAPNLKKVELRNCDAMECFLPGNPNNDADLQFRSLDIVDIDYCYKIHSLSYGRLVAPRLTLIKYRDNELSLLPFRDVNHFLKNASTSNDPGDWVNDIQDIEEQEEEEEEEEPEEEQEEELYEGVDEDDEGIDTD